MSVLLTDVMLKYLKFAGFGIVWGWGWGELLNSLLPDRKKVSRVVHEVLEGLGGIVQTERHERELE
jgi:hypothetical protein